MKKIYELENELKNLEQQRKKYENIQNMTITDFIVAKKIISRETQIKKCIDQCNNSKKIIEETYENSTNDWISNLKINCRKYEKLEKKARYNRDKKLYSLGFSNVHPTPPIFQESSFIYKIYSKVKKYNFFKPLVYKFRNFVSDTFPKKMNNIAVYTTKKCISGYRSMNEEIKYYKNCVSQIPPVKYIKSIKNEAIRQLDSISEHDAYVASLHPNNFKDISFHAGYILPSKPVIHHEVSPREHIIG